MSWSYSGNPQSSTRDECRFLIGDTNEKMPIMQDEEIDYLITTTGNDTNKLRYELFKHAATIFARDIKRSLGPQSEDPTERLRFFNDQANYYKDKIAVAGLSLPKYASPKVFNKGMQNNPPFRSKQGGYL
jgi:hypothetical protein